MLPDVQEGGHKAMADSMIARDAGEEEFAVHLGQGVHACWSGDS